MFIFVKLLLLVRLEYRIVLTLELLFHINIISKVKFLLNLGFFFIFKLLKSILVLPQIVNRRENQIYQFFISNLYLAKLTTFDVDAFASFIQMK